LPTRNEKVLILRSEDIFAQKLEDCSHACTCHWNACRNG
jgi:hypothetical protein